MFKALMSFFLLTSAAAADPSRQSLFVSGEGGYASYRIPALITTKNGTLLAFCEGRRHSASDTGEINLLMRRSTDGGKTFSPPAVIWADGTNTCGNPCPVVDAGTGIIRLLMTHNPGVAHEKEIDSGAAAGTRTVWISRSDDDGVTWSKPADITASVKRPNWRWYATGPGIGIQLTRGDHKGRLIIPCDYSAAAGGGNSHVIYSDDHGQTWAIGGEPTDKRYNESQCVELEDGQILLNMRNRRAKSRPAPSPGRGIAVSGDGGLTFGPGRDDPALPEPVCQASILRYSWKADGPGVILFSNPAHAEKRQNMTVRLSEDDGRTWPVSCVVWEAPAAYSCLTRLPGGDVGLLYECGEKKPYERIELARFSLQWLRGGGGRRD